MELQAQAVGSKNTSKPGERLTETTKGFQRDLHGSLPVSTRQLPCFLKTYFPLKEYMGSFEK